MMRFTKGNLLEANVEAVVNTVNTVGVMGKGIALMFKERFPKNYQEYVVASKSGAVQIGKMFVTATDELSGPNWIINFPTKEHWRYPTKIEWVRAGGGTERCNSRETNQLNCSARSWLWEFYECPDCGEQIYDPTAMRQIGALPRKSKFVLGRGQYRPR